MLIRFTAIVCLLAIPPAVGYRYFLDRIPNGRRVPHPCKPNDLWEGVGHFNDAGSGHINPFGQDFDDAGHNWTKALCQKDSDGDGKTNGQELGDPDCTWRPNEPPKFASGLSHPGVCEPLDSLYCQQRNFSVSVFKQQSDWMTYACKRGEFVCQGLNDTDVKNVTFQFPKTPVPAEETTYMCAVFDFPEPDSDVHMIATSPVLDNRQVLHHAVLFGCRGEVAKRFYSPYRCGMSAHDNCNTIVSLWSLGKNGECYHNNTGIKLGARGLKTLALQLHWNNPERTATYQDASGMTLYYTPKLRPNDAGVWMVGNDDFDIPPRREMVEVHAVCTPGCTQQMISEPVYVTAAWNHMHYLGVSQTVEHYRNGTKLRDVTNEVDYRYDSPQMHAFPTPFEVRPGDELRTTCRYNSMSRSTTTSMGQSTQAEMCYGFLYYYPAHAIKELQCVSFRSISRCDVSTSKGCNWDFTTFRAEVEANCALHTCYAECKETITRGRLNNTCLANEDIMTIQKKSKWPRSKEGLQFMVKLSSCDAEIYADNMATEKGDEGGDNDGDEKRPACCACVVTYSLALIALSVMLM